MDSNWRGSEGTRQLQKAAGVSEIWPFTRGYNCGPRTVYFHDLLTDTLLSDTVYCSQRFLADYFVSDLSLYLPMRIWLMLLKPLRCNDNRFLLEKWYGSTFLGPCINFTFDYASSSKIWSELGLGKTSNTESTYDSWFFCSWHNH